MDFQFLRGRAPLRRTASAAAVHRTAALRQEIAASGGSQVSLPALQLIGVSLTDLPTLEVYEG